MGYNGSNNREGANVTVRVQDVLKANLTLVGVGLLGSDEERERFGRGVGTDVSGAIAGFALPPIPGLTARSQDLELGQRLRLDRDRIELEIVGDRTIIGIEYPSKDRLARLAQIATLAIKSSDISDHDLRGVGFNLEAVYELTSGSTAYEFLAGRVFAPNLFQAAGYQIRGGAAKLLLTRGDEVWNVTLEPRFNNPEESRLFASFNLHQNTNRMPKTDSIKPTLESVWDQAHLITRHFD